MKHKINHKLNARSHKIGLLIFLLLFAGVGGYFIVNGKAAVTCDQTLSSGANISSAVSSAAAGTTVCLNDGSYPSLTLSGVNKSSYVTIKSVNGPANVTIASLSLTNISFIRLDGITYIGSGTTLAITGAHDLQIINSIGISKILRVNITQANSNILFDNDKFINVDPPCYTNNCVEGRLSFDSPGTPPNPAGVTVSNSYFGGGNSDGIQIGNVRGLKIIGNEFNDISAHGTAAHTDPIQLYAGSASAYPMDTVIDSNYIHNTDSNIMAPDGSTNTQLTNNVIDNTGYPYPVNAGHWNGGLIEHNTFNISTACPWEAHCGTPWIQSVTNPVIIRNNIMGGLKNDAGSSAVTATKNLTPAGVSVGSSPVNGIPTFVGGASPSKFSDFVLASGSVGKGAASDGKDIGINLATQAVTGQTANIWVDGNGGTCIWTATPVEYDDATACSTFDKAWDKAAAGNIIRVKTGTYPAQLVDGDKASETKIIGENGTKVAGGMECEAVFGGYGAFCANAKYMTLENVTIDSLNNAGKSSGSMINSPNVTFRNVNLYGDYVNLNIDGGADYFLWQHGSHGQDGIDGKPRGCDVSQGEPVWVFAANATLDNIRFNPKKIIAGTPGPYCGTDNTPHVETIRIESGGNNLTVKNSWFTPGTDAGSGHIFTSTGGPGLKLINNIFDPVNGSYSIQAGSSACDWTLLYNTFTQGTVVGCTSASTWVGNLGSSSPGCSGTHIKNVWLGANNGTSCNGADKTYSNLGIGTAGHLTSTSPAINAAEAGTGSDYCVGALVGAKDYEGNTRPVGAACDAGASEYGSSTTPTPKPGDTNNDNVVNIIDLSTLLSKWNTNYSAADFNKDNTVNIFDLSILLSNYGK